jgi:hypothetical protein
MKISLVSGKKMTVELLKIALKAFKASTKGELIL